MAGAAAAAAAARAGAGAAPPTRRLTRPAVAAGRLPTEAPLAHHRSGPAAQRRPAAAGAARQTRPAARAPVIRAGCRRSRRVGAACGGEMRARR